MKTPITITPIIRVTEKRTGTRAVIVRPPGGELHYFGAISDVKDYFKAFPNMAIPGSEVQAIADGKVHTEGCKWEGWIVENAPQYIQESR